jgi:type IV pilus assembly protein PilN
MRLTINLATRRYINMRQLDAGLAVCFIILGTLLVFKVREAAYNQAELGRIAKLNAGADRRPGAAPVSEVKLQALGARIRFANTLIDKKSMNWLNLLDRLEEVVPTGVVLTQIEPSPRDRQLKITGLAHSFANLRQLLENMEQSKNLSEVYLLSQSEVKVGLTQQGLNFAVTCKVSYR